jgi:hypothetical protein
MLVNRGIAASQLVDACYISGCQSICACNLSVLGDHHPRAWKSVEAAQRRPVGANQRGPTNTGVNDTTLPTLPARANDETRLSSPPSDTPSPSQFFQRHCEMRYAWCWAMQGLRSGPVSRISTARGRCCLCLLGVHVSLSCLRRIVPPRERA